MKKNYVYLLLGVFLILFSCRSESGSDNQSNGSKINPPAWIKGTWKLQADYDQTYTFTNNDIIIKTAGMTTNIKPIADLGAYSQTSSDTEFTFTTSMQNLTQTYKFKKVTSTKILFDHGLGGNDYSMWSEMIKQ